MTVVSNTTMRCDSITQLGELVGRFAIAIQPDELDPERPAGVSVSPRRALRRAMARALQTPPARKVEHPEPSVSRFTRT